MAKDFSQLSKEELLSIVERLESRKKYGLIWDEEKVKEQFEKDSENALPILKSIKGKEVKGKNALPNILIEGDNYHSLSVLNFTHQEKIDLIYIDPPYNTGNKDFIYNDSYVDKEDAYKHSKWLSFMSKRLKLAKNLLSETGMIFISIDDNEQAQLKLLCNEIFGENNFIANIIWQKKYTQSNDAKYFSDTHDFIFCYAKNSTANGFKINLLSRTVEQNDRYKNPDNDPRGPWLTGPLHAKSGSATKYSHTFKNGIVWTPPPGTFPRFKKETLDRAEEEGRIWFGAKGTAVPRMKKYLNEMKEGVIPRTLWLYDEVGSNDEAKRELKTFFKDNIFNSPKPTRLIKRIIQLATKEDSIVMDFFAGSGTTGQAVLDFNSENGGNRTFILCNNNEINNGTGKVVDDVCFPRIKKVVQEHNTSLKYFKTAFVKVSPSKDELKIRLANECTEMLCLREGVFEEIKSTSDYKIFKQEDKILTVYFSLEKDALKALKKELDKLDGTKTLYCFTLDPLGLSKSDFIGWNDVILEPIPQKILDVYKQIYEY